MAPEKRNGFTILHVIHGFVSILNELKRVM